MKRPLFVLFLLTALGIFLFYPRSYQPDPVFPQGLYYPVTVTGRLQNWQPQANGQTLTLTDCLISYDNDQYQCTKLLVTADMDASSFHIGDILHVSGDLSSFSPARNPGNFDWYSYYRARHISYRIYADQISVLEPGTAILSQALLDLRRSMTQCLQQVCGDDVKTASLLTALLLGDKTLLEEDTRSKYTDGGILHILTVSGLHVSLLGNAILSFGKKLYLPPWLRNLLSSLLILLYWQLCGGGISPGRAAVMFFCLMAAPLVGRTYDSLSALSLAGILILWSSPLQLFQSSFQLSFGAILGIHLVCPAFLPFTDPTTTSMDPARLSNPAHLPAPMSSRSPHNIFLSLLNTLQTTLMFSLGLQITLLPVTLYHFFRYPLYGILLNLLVLPLTTPLFLLGSSGLLLSCLFPAQSMPATSLVLLPCQWILAFYDKLCTITSRFPHASLLLGRPGFWRIGLYYGALILFCLWRYKKLSTLSALCRRTSCLLALSLLLSILFAPISAAQMSIVFLDVGQGDCAFLETPAGTTILIDCGSSDLKQMAQDRLIPFLESRGIQHLDYVFLSHTDQDHTNGVIGWLEHGGSIGAMILPALSDRLIHSSYEKILSYMTEYHIPVHFFSQGMTWQEEDVSLTCLAPVSGDDPQAGQYADANAASQVLMFQYQGIRILFTGDCEKEGEEILLSQLKSLDLTCHILKVGHHGSAYATSQAFLEQLTPQAAIISCGIHNSYGHPHPSTLSRIGSVNCSCHVTASCGAVTVTIRQGTARLQTFLTHFRGFRLS